MGRLHDKVAVVTGAGRGLGRAMALALADKGARVVLAARSTDQLNVVAHEIEALRSEALIAPTDVTNPDSVEQLADRAVARFGRVDILVNNSGILATRSLLEQTVDEMDAVFVTNIRGTFLVTQSIGHHMVAQKSGKIINIASNFALKGVPLHTAYCSSKAAIVAFTKSLAMEWARYNIQVNALAPGYFATDLTAGARNDPAILESILKSVPARRMGEPDELVPWVLLLADSASDFMTGETVVIDGGQCAR